MFIIKNCKLVPELTEDTTLRMADIVIDGQNIVNIVPCGSDVPEGAECLDVEGKTVIPGLINGHLHLIGASNPKKLPFNPRGAHAALDALRFSQYLLKNGYTTVRNCSDTDDYPVIELRNHINAGYFEGPTIICSGMTHAPTEVNVDIPWVRNCDTPEDIRRGVRRDLAHGADFIKIYASGSMLSPGQTDPNMRIMEEDEIAESVRIAKLKGTYVCAHCHSDNAVSACVRNGVRTIEHATFISEETLQLMDGRSDTGLILTLSLFLRFTKMPVVPEPYKSMMDKSIECLKNACQHDITIGWGTDVGMDDKLPEVGSEFRLRKELLGCSNVDLLKQATINTAKLLRIDSRVGSIKVGKMADLVIVNGDPTEDISLMYTAPAYVIKNGTLVH